MSSRSRARPSARRTSPSISCTRTARDGERSGRWRASIARSAERLVPELPYIAAELDWGDRRTSWRARSAIYSSGRLHVAFETRDHGLSIAPAMVERLAPLLSWNVEDELQSYRREIDDLFGIAEG